MVQDRPMSSSTQRAPHADPTVLLGGGRGAHCTDPIEGPALVPNFVANGMMLISIQE